MEQPHSQLTGTKIVFGEATNKDVDAILASTISTCTTKVVDKKGYIKIYTTDGRIREYEISTSILMKTYVSLLNFLVQDDEKIFSLNADFLEFAQSALVETSEA
jgi:hypothetical protein